MLKVTGSGYIASVGYSSLTFTYNTLTIQDLQFWLQPIKEENDEILEDSNEMIEVNGEEDISEFNSNTLLKRKGSK